MMSKHAQIGDFRGLGAMCAMEIVEDPKTKKPGAKLLAQIIKECNKRGMLDCHLQYAQQQHAFPASAGYH